MNIINIKTKNIEKVGQEEKKWRKVLVVGEKVVPLHSQLKNCC